MKLIVESLEEREVLLRFLVEGERVTGDGGDCCDSQEWRWLGGSSNGGTGLKGKCGWGCGIVSKGRTAVIAVMRGKHGTLIVCS